jgi:predicted unusual protein kinase regulating ubiquinone biosynthesis (AarF/ABC1/UbiB family)
MFGQLQNLVPDEYCEVFEPMCMKAPTTKYPDVKSIVESELGCSIDDVFSDFCHTPIASASLG